MNNKTSYAAIAKRLAAKKKKYAKLQLEGSTGLERHTGGLMSGRVDRELTNLFENQEMSKAQKFFKKIMASGGNIPKYFGGGNPSQPPGYDPWADPMTGFDEDEDDLQSRNAILNGVGGLGENYGLSGEEGEITGGDMTGIYGGIGGKSSFSTKRKKERGESTFSPWYRFTQLAQLAPEAVALSRLGKVQAPELSRMNRVSLDKIVRTDEEEASADRIMTAQLDRSINQGKAGAAMVADARGQTQGFLNKVFANKRLQESQIGNQEAAMNMEVDKYNTGIDNQEEIYRVMREQGIEESLIGALSSATSKLGAMAKDDRDFRLQKAQADSIMKMYEHSGIGQEYLGPIMEMINKLLSKKDDDGS